METAGIQIQQEDGNNKKVKVCVTGGGGFVASWLIMKLLARGYSVRATLRSDSKLKKDISHITSLPGASDNLELFDADLTRPDSFAPAIGGCVGVFHVATPTDVGRDDYDRTVARVTVDGVLGILRACAASGTVRRVVYTSTACAAMLHGGGGVETAGRGTVVLDESVWTDVEFFRAQKDMPAPLAAYCVSKTLAERAALDFGAEHGLEVVTVLPCCVVGPFLVPSLPNSVALGLAVLRGDAKSIKLLENVDNCGLKKNLQFVHIDDIAAAHIFLLECPEARGRYICSAVDITIRSLAAFLRAKFPDFDIPHKLVRGGEDGEEEPAVRLSSKKLQSLGFEFKYGLEAMFDEAIQCCKQKGFL